MDSHTSEKNILKTSRCLYNSKLRHASSPSLFSKEFKHVLAPAFDWELTVVHGRPCSRGSQMFLHNRQKVQTASKGGSPFERKKKLGTGRALNS